MDTEKQRQRRRDDARLTESGNARSEQLLVVPTESLTNREIMAVRRALEWIRTSKARLVFRYEISDLFLQGRAEAIIFTLKRGYVVTCVGFVYVLT